MTTKYTSIRAVLYDLSLTIDERYWNEVKVLEWLNHGLRQLNISATLEQKVSITNVLLHKAELPSDFKYLTQIAYYTGTENCCTSTVVEDLQLPTSSTMAMYIPQEIDWRPMRLTSNPYHNSIDCVDKQLMYCTDCDHEFSISPGLIITTTLKSGPIMISYLAYPTDEHGDNLMPDDETLKEALFHYVLYRYWLAKYQMKEDGARERIKFHLDMWSTLAIKATGNLNMPGINELENIKAQYNRLVPRENRFQQMFLTLGNRENVNF